MTPTEKGLWTQSLNPQVGMIKTHNDWRGRCSSLPHSSRRWQHSCSFWKYFILSVSTIVPPLPSPCFPKPNLIHMYARHNLTYFRVYRRGNVAELYDSSFMQEHGWGCVWIAAWLYTGCPGVVFGRRIVRKMTPVSITWLFFNVTWFRRFFFFHARSQNCEKLLLALSCNVRPRGITGLPLYGFSWNLVFEYFSKICQRIQVSLQSDKNIGYFTWRAI
jgi:hypothetical protein